MKDIYHYVKVRLWIDVEIQVAVWAPEDSGDRTLLEMAKTQIKQHVESAELVEVTHG